MFDIDFNWDLLKFFRFWLGWAVTIYVTILTVQWLWGWVVWLRGQDRYIGMLRRYLLVHGLRLRFKTFWGDLIICILLTVAFFLLWHAQNLMHDIELALQRDEGVARVEARSR